jgi:hypothetical protein
MLFGICHTRRVGSGDPEIWFGKLGITTRLESPFKFDIVWQLRIWYRISTDIIGYAKQV